MNARNNVGDSERIGLQPRCAWGGGGVVECNLPGRSSRGGRCHGREQEWKRFCNAVVVVVQRLAGAGGGGPCLPPGSTGRETAFPSKYQ